MKTIYQIKNNINFNKNNLNIFENENKNLFEKSIEDGTYNIIPMHCCNRAIDIDGASTENYANLLLYEYNNTIAQKFEVKFINKDNCYTIKSLCSNKLLTVDNKNNDNIIQYEETKDINQQWQIVRKGNNYEIISKYNGYLMDVNGNTDNITANISCKPRTDGLNQQFQFNKLPSNFKKNINYFPIPDYDENSIVDALASINVDNSESNRRRIAAANNIEGYNFSPEQNIRLLDLLKRGKLIKPS